MDRSHQGGYQQSEGKNSMSELEKQIANRAAENADLDGAQDLIDAHIDEVTGGAFSLHIQYTDPPVPPVGPIRRY